MKSFKLSFGIISILRKDLAEVIVNDGIEMNIVQAEEYLDFLLNNLQSPFSLLINKKHSYTYTFEAQKMIVSNEKIKNLAVVIGTSGGLMSSETLLSLNKNSNWNTRFFSNRDEGIAWLSKKSHNKNSQTL